MQLEVFCRHAISIFMLTILVFIYSFKKNKEKNIFLCLLLICYHIKREK